MGQESCDSRAALCPLHQAGLWHSTAPQNHRSEHRQEAESLLCCHSRVPQGSIHPRGSCEDESHPQPGCSISPQQLPGGFSCSSPPPAQPNLPGGTRCDPLRRDQGVLPAVSPRNQPGGDIASHPAQPDLHQPPQKNPKKTEHGMNNKSSDQ